MLLLLKWSTLSRVSRHIAYGLYELLKTGAANIHTDTDWALVFTLLECVGAGRMPPRVVGSTPSTHETGKLADCIIIVFVIVPTVNSPMFYLTALTLTHVENEELLL